MGVVSGRDENKLGLDGSSTTALMLDDVKVPVENVLGTIGEGHKVAFNILNLGRVKLGRAQHGGRASRRSTTPVKYAKERRQFGQRDRRVRPDQAEARRDGGALLRRRRDGRTARSATSIARSSRVDRGRRRRRC